MDKATIKDILRFKRRNLDEEDIANILEVDINEVKQVISISATLNKVYAKRKLKKYSSEKSPNKKKTISKIPKKEKVSNRKPNYYEEERKQETLIHDYNSYKKNAISEIKNKTDVILYRSKFFNKAKELVQSGKTIPLEDIKALADSVSTVPDLFKSYNIGFVIKCYENYDAKDKIIDFIDDCKENENYYGNDKYINDLVKKYGELSARQKEIKKEKRKIEAAEAKKKREEKKKTKPVVIKERKIEPQIKHDVTNTVKPNTKKIDDKVQIENKENPSKENDTNKNEPIKPRKRVKKKTLYDYLEGCSKEEVNKALLTLTEKQKEWLTTYFDKNYNRNNVPQKSGEIPALVRAIKTRIENARAGINNKTKNLYDYFSDYTKEEVDLAISMLTKRQKEKIKLYFDENLIKNDVPFKYNGEKRFLITAIQKNLIKIRENKITTNDIAPIKKTKKSKNENKVRKRKMKKTLYDYLEGYTKEEVDKALLTLTDKQKGILDTYFDENLNRNDVPETKIRIRNLISAIKSRINKERKRANKEKNNKPKIEEARKRVKKKTLYDYLEGYTKEEVDNALLTITDKQKEILNRYFDKDLNRNDVPQRPGEIRDLIKAIKSRIHKNRQKNGTEIKNNDKTRKRNDYSDICKNFSEFPREQVISVANNLSGKAKIYRETYYDENLIRNEIPVEYTVYLQNLYTVIYHGLVPPAERNKETKKLTENTNKDEPIEILEVDNSNNKIIEKKNFTEYFSEYDISFNIIKKLIEVDKDRQKFIYKYFDKNLNTIVNIISEEDFAHLNQIIDQIKDLAEFEKKVREAKLQNKLGSLYGYDNEIQEERKEDVIENNDEDNSEPIEEVIENSDNNSVQEETTENIVDNSNLTTDISDNLDISNEDLINIYQMFKTGYFLSFLEQKSEIEIKVMKMKLGYQDQKYFPSKHIAEELNITEDEAIRIYKNIIKEYEEILLKELEKERQKNRKRILTYEQEHNSTKQG